MLRRLAILATVLIVGTTALDAALGSSGRDGLATGKATAPRPAAPSHPSPETKRVAAAIGAVQQAFDAGDVRQLCRPGALVDPAVIREQASQPGGCESELETLVAHGPIRLAVGSVAVKPDLATAAVRTADGATVPVDLVRDGSRWLLSFSDGDDPLPALTD